MIHDIEKNLERKVKRLLIIFIISLLLSGVTAFPIETELSIANRYIHLFPGYLRNWISDVYSAVKTTNEQFPYLSYGTDWLAFAHIVISIAFIGPLKDPVKNIWVIQFGLISCILVFPLAFIAGHLRGIPFYWQLIDCSFGIFGFLLLFSCYKAILRLEELQNRNNRPAVMIGPGYIN